LPSTRELGESDKFGCCPVRIRSGLMSGVFRLCMRGRAYAEPADPAGRRTPVQAKRSHTLEIAHVRSDLKGY